MNFFQRLLAKFAQHKKRNTAVAAAGMLGLVTITTSQVVTPNSEAPGGFPTANSVGPATDPTITYTGDCNFDSSDDGLIIDARIVDCEANGLRFAAGDYTVTFTNSIILGQMFTFQYTPGDAGADDFPKDPIFIVQDSDILQTQTNNGQDRAVCCSHYVVERSYLQGTHSVAASHNNGVIRDSFLTTDGTSTHSSGIRFLKNSIVDGNTIICKPAYLVPDDAGCSASAVFYSEDLQGISAAAFNMDITNNYFKRGTFQDTGTVASAHYATRFVDCHNRVDCTDIQFTGNQFDIGWGTDGGEFPFYSNNTWANNTWSDGAVATSGQDRE